MTLKIAVGTSRREAIICILLISVFVLALTLHGYLSRPTLDRYGDMYENYAWGVLWRWGYYKHPPFFAWETATWFLLFPHNDFSYFLLAGVNAGAALVALWRIAARYGAAGFRVLVLVLAIVMPPISFQGLNFNANSAMTPMWALLFLFYLRNLEQRRLVDAVILGALAAIAMLTKYHSALMLASLLIHALSDSEARPILFSRTGLVAAVTFTGISLPHLLWLHENSYLPLGYAAHQQGDGGASVTDSLLFLVAPLGYCSLSILIARSLRDARDSFPLLPLEAVVGLRHTTAGRALIAYSAGPLLLTIVAGYIANANLSAVWGVPFYPPYAILIVMLVPAAYHEERVSRALAIVTAFLALIVVIAPFWYLHERRLDTIYTARLASLASEIDRRWLEAGGKPNGVTFGNLRLSNAVSFYSHLDLKALEGNKFQLGKVYLTSEEAAKRGLIGICEAGNKACARLVTSRLPGVSPQTFALDGYRPGRVWTFKVWLAP